ncbi:hypothetical protein [Leptospira noguchii]|uniref:Uncharacterized protein n=1 Tax=Leptospira noguchii serovar Autumnalis str. ZUN142 TaxID=1085540 RepID=M6UP94_9LEPT|nr:hypothetical protein [Leptospira noguchii]EMO42879.1 hypothetical protein LEP1GSC186_0118 [Leptospira noguchii serovar Autumnalis str. ZUN142]
MGQVLNLKINFEIQTSEFVIVPTSKDSKANSHLELYKRISNIS